MFRKNWELSNSSVKLVKIKVCRGFVRGFFLAGRENTGKILLNCIARECVKQVFRFLRQRQRTEEGTILRENRKRRAGVK